MKLGLLPYSLPMFRGPINFADLNELLMKITEQARRQIAERTQQRKGGSV